MELRQLRYFLAVADAGSFSGAAAALGVIQPTVSQYIQRLETRLHTNLFERHARGVRLTFAGRHLLRAAHRIVFEVHRGLGLAARVSRTGAGQLLLGFCTSLSAGPLRDVLAGLRAQSPDVAIELYEGNPPDLLAALREYRVDVALTVLEVNSPEFETLRLSRPSRCSSTRIVSLR
jgi:DNA-binding transcriptional LysR family regulator